MWVFDFLSLYDEAEIEKVKEDDNKGLRGIVYDCTIIVYSERGTQAFFWRNKGSGHFDPCMV